MAAELIELGTAAGPVTLTSNFQNGLSIGGLTTKPNQGGDVLTISHSVIFTDLNPATDINPGNINVNQNQVSLSTGGSTTNRVRGNFVRRGGPVGGGNQGQFYGVASSDDSGTLGGFKFDGFDNANEIGITDGLSGQTSDTFVYRMVLTNNLAVGTTGTTDYDMRTEVVDSAGTVLYSGGALSGRDLSGLFGGATYDANFGTFFTTYIDSTTISDASVTLDRVAAVPEPGIIGFIAFGLAGLVVAKRRRKAKLLNAE